MISADSPSNDPFFLCYNLGMISGRHSCILIVMFMYSYCYVCSVLHILFAFFFLMLAIPKCLLTYLNYTVSVEHNNRFLLY